MLLYMTTFFSVAIPERTLYRIKTMMKIYTENFLFYLLLLQIQLGDTGKRDNEVY